MIRFTLKIPITPKWQYNKEEEAVELLTRLGRLIAYERSCSEVTNAVIQPPKATNE